jgi:aromatic-amino-acid transaminase
MPPAHGAATVAHILADPRLNALWRDELAQMRERLLGLRRELAVLSVRVPILRGVDEQRGIFRMLPLTAAQIQALADDHAIHMPGSGRINLAGLKRGSAERLALALADVTAA